MLALVTGAADAQARLGEVSPGGQLRIPFDDVVPPSRLRVEIDGVAYDLPLSVDGRHLLVTLPDGLQGREHDLVLFRRQPDMDTELGVWTFTVPTGRAEASLYGTLEVEHRRGNAGSNTLLQGNGRIGFSVDGDRLRAGLGFVQSGSTRRGGASTEVSDYFLETRQAVLGQDLIARLGTQTLPAENLLLADDSWRGASLRLVSPDARSDVMAFALQPGEASGRTNLTGLGNPDARVSGVAAQVFPFGTASLRADVVAFRGRADLGAGVAGDVQGKGFRLSGPVGADIADFAIDYATTDTGSAGTAAAASASAIEAEIGLALLPAAQSNSLELRVSGARREPGFFSPLNPDLIADEQRRRAELRFLSDEWQWTASAETGQSNVKSNPALPTDRFRSLGLDLTFSPYVFTGGFWQGVTFYGSFLSEDQTRLITPAGGPDPQDFRLDSASFGMDRFQPDHSWALGVKLDRLTDLSGAGESERRRRIEAAFALTPDDLSTFTLRAEAGQTDASGDWKSDGILELSYAFPIIPDLWAGYLETGATRVQGDGSKDGAYFGVELQRTLSPSTDLLIRADYGEGTKADALSPDDGWTIGLALRHDFGAGTP